MNIPLMATESIRNSTEYKIERIDISGEMAE